MKYTPTGPLGTTQRGTVVEVISHKGCGLLTVRRASDGETRMCDYTALTMNTQKDKERLRAILPDGPSYEV